MEEWCACFGSFIHREPGALGPPADARGGRHLPRHFRWTPATRQGQPSSSPLAPGPCRWLGTRNWSEDIFV